MSNFVVLASAVSPHLSPVTRDPDGTATAFVFPDADAALAFGRSRLNHNEDKWITNTLSPAETEAWLDDLIEDLKVSHVAPNPDGPDPRVLPAEVFRMILRAAQARPGNH
jgi:hypothetical protein